jgi:hypothetical protein
MRVAPFVLGLFFAFATCVLVAVGFALLFPGSPFDAVWSLYEARRAMLMPYRDWLGPGFLLLGAVMVCAFWGNLTRAQWGRWLAIGVFAGNALGDLAQVAMGHVAEGLLGAAIAVTLLVWLTRPATKALYA